VGHHAVQKMIGDFWDIGKFVPVGFPFCLRVQRNQNGWKLLFHPPYSPDLAPSDYYLFGPLKDHLRDHHYGTDEAVQEAVRSWLRGAGTDLYRRGMIKILHCWQKCIDRDGDSAEK
jgi:hypothetical protein